MAFIKQNEWGWKGIEWHRSSPMHGVRVQTLFLFVSNNFLRGQSWRISLPPFIWVGKVKCHFQKKPRQGFPDFQRSIRRLKKERHLYTCEGLHGYTKCLHSVCHFVHGKYVVRTANFSTFLALYHLAISFFHTFFFFLVVWETDLSFSLMSTSKTLICSFHGCQAICWGTFSFWE